MDPSADSVVEFGLEQLGFDRPFLEDLAGRLIASASSLAAEVKRLRTDVTRRVDLAWQIRFGAKPADTEPRFTSAAERAWTQVATAVAVTVLHDLLAEAAGAEGSPEKAASALDAADILLAATLGSRTASIAGAPATAVPAGSLLSHALELFAHGSASQLATGANPARRLPAFAGAVERYAAAAAAAAADDLHRFTAHLLIAALFEFADDPSDTERLRELAAGLPVVTALDPFDSNDIEAPEWAVALPAARNLLVLLATKHVAHDEAYDVVTGVLDEIEGRCGACLGPEGCQDAAGGCARRGDDDAPYCTALLVVYLRALQSLWNVVRVPESLDHAVTIAEGRSRGGRHELFHVLVELRCGRFEAYRRQDDRAYLHRIFNRDDYTALPVWVPGWLLATVRSTTTAGMSTPEVVQTPISVALGLDREVFLNAVFRTLDDPRWPMGPFGRIPVWLDLARRCAEHGYAEAELEALEGHRELCDELYHGDTRVASRAFAVEARMAGGPLHAARLAEAGRFAEAVDRLETDQRNDLRLMHVFDRTNLGPLPSVAEDQEELREVEERLLTITADTSAEPTSSVISLQRRAQLLRDRITARTVFEPGPGRACLDLVRKRAASLDCPMLYLWSSEAGGHLLAITPETGPKPVRYFGLGAELSMSSLDFVVRELADARSPRATAAAYENALKACLHRGLGSALAQAAPGGRAVLVPVGRWRAIPLHVACEIGAEATDDAGPLPVLSYAATGVPTTPMPLLTTLTTRPSMIMTDLAAGSMPDRAVADIVDMECRLLETRLGPQATILNGPDATGQSLAGFLRSQPDCGLVHLSIHGSERAEDRPAWVDEQATETATNGAIGHAMAIPELCTVLACTSAGADQEYLDEVVRMQQSTMLGGIPEVVLNQWPAGDLAAALFSSYFYQRLLGDGMPCWQAVHEARAWLRSLTDDDVIAYIDQQGVEDRPSLVSGSQKTFGDLWGWGGFAHVQAW